MRKFQQYITEGVYDPSIFKAFFLAGGPGSGKSWVSTRALSGMGLKVIDTQDLPDPGPPARKNALKIEGS